MIQGAQEDSFSWKILFLHLQHALNVLLLEVFHCNSTEGGGLGSFYDLSVGSRANTLAELVLGLELALLRGGEGAEEVGRFQD